MTASSPCPMNVLTAAVNGAAVVLTSLLFAVLPSVSAQPPASPSVVASVPGDCLGAWAGSYDLGAYDGRLDVRLEQAGASVQGSGQVTTAAGRGDLTVQAQRAGDRLVGMVSSAALAWSASLDVRCTADRLTGRLGQGTVSLGR